MKEKEKEKTSRTREPLDPRKVAPPKQVKYFFKYFSSTSQAGQVLLQVLVKYFPSRSSTSARSATSTSATPASGLSNIENPKKKDSTIHVNTKIFLKF